MLAATAAAAVAALACLGAAHHGLETAAGFTGEWLVRLEGGLEAAEQLARETGFTLRGQVIGFPDTYRMAKEDHPEIHKRDHRALTQRLSSDSRVVWAEQQFAKRRSKRGLLPPTDGSPVRSKRRDLDVPPQRDVIFNDELWEQEWYLQDTRTRPDLPKLDLHVLPLYEMGVTGRGVRVCVLDDGLEYLHEDLRDNYDPDISYDVNDDDADPTPRYDRAGTNSHGTRCAGEIAMAANNGKCGVGVAFNARIGGVRLLDGVVDDGAEGSALGFARHLVDVYSASWGPTDDGMTVEGPGRLASEAIARGVAEGRGGKGAIFVWASGNGGSRGDNCDCDGYISSVHTLAVGSASQQGQFPWYGERCAATLAATYSSGAYSDQMIATTDLRNSCTIRHTGTSASAPLAAGIIALALEVNPELTWRDVQHLVVWTSEYAPLSDNDGWQRNAAGFWASTRFGYGLMNALALVTAAANWTSVPPKLECEVTALPLANSSLAHGRPLTAVFPTAGCEVAHLEHAQVTVELAYPVRGVLQIHLTSAAGTRVQLLSTRKLDKSDYGFKNWTFMSVLTWGEDPRGVWQLEIVDKDGLPSYRGSAGWLALRLHGTAARPRHLAAGPRKYDQDYNSVHRKAPPFTFTYKTPEENYETNELYQSSMEKQIIKNGYMRDLQWLKKELDFKKK
ncbi:neuroendocrine convertase 1-like [Bacillus rossius redtenbacheri]|uniref:neuroendocrine convertase 1-like n=1 Tax=Bacillus rossius redtenbacheri TaxID=93214 RepID=UPI002FDE73D3